VLRSRLAKKGGSLVVQYVIIMWLMAVALAFYAWLHPSFAWILLWSSLSFSLVAIGYAGLGARVFGKTSSGIIPWWSKLILSPYIVLIYILWHVTRLVSKEAPRHEIDASIVIGRRLLESEAQGDYDYYIDLTAEFEEPKGIRQRNSYVSFPILDAGVPTAGELEQLLSQVKGGRVYIHCAQGHGRTGLVAIALLLRQEKVKTVSEGMRLLQQQRTRLKLNQLQEKFLEEFAS